MQTWVKEDWGKKLSRERFLAHMLGIGLDDSIIEEIRKSHDKHHAQQVQNQ